MIKHAIFTAGIVAGLITTSAQAQDWAGAYGGGALSYGVGTNQGFFTFFGLLSSQYDAEVTGAHVRGFAGHNWYLSDTVVTGVELSAGFGEISGSGVGGNPGQSANMTYGTSATLAVRFAYDAGRALPFISFGVTTTEVSSSYTIPALGPIERDATFRTGTTVGAGVDYQISDRSFLRIQVSHTQMDDIQYGLTAFPPPNTGVSLIPQVITNPSYSDVTVGYAFRF
ncbi:outer membrane protein [Gymnodinialimonas hymeniacidonis]|uniref:outer membrane protein n=1 Tax=Gymnodinialimonas hymeniacidonis TaxID=3126508 RepID=UPI0034C6AFAD